jgi:hypothetical protein
MKKLLLVMVGTAAFFTLTGCRHLGHLWSAGGIKGSGVAKTEKREVGAFKGVEVGGALKIEVTCQKAQGVEITADDNLLRYIKTEVRDGVLHIGTAGVQFSASKTPRIIVTLPELNRVGVSGASQMKVANLKTDDFKINLSGAAQLDVSGTAQLVDANLSGACRLDGKDLKAANVDINASGASNADVYASAELKAEASGASKIHYYGSPQSVSPRANGASKITAGS